MQKTVPITYLHHDDQQIEPAMQKKICGIMCVAMILATHQKDFGTVQDLVNEGKKTGSYISGIGWTHQGLVDLLGRYGVRSERREFRKLLGDDQWRIASDYKESLRKSIDQDEVIIISVDKGFGENLTSTHLAVLHGYILDDRGEVVRWVVSDPSSLRHEQEEITQEYLERHFRGLGVLVGMR